MRAMLIGQATDRLHMTLNEVVDNIASTQNDTAATTAPDVVTMIVQDEEGIVSSVNMRMSHVGQTPGHSTNLGANLAVESIQCLDARPGPICAMRVLRVHRALDGDTHVVATMSGLGMDFVVSLPPAAWQAPTWYIENEVTERIQRMLDSEYTAAAQARRSRTHGNRDRARSRSPRRE